MKKLHLLFAVMLAGLLLFSCGLRIPSKLPEKANVKYTKNLEFPVTTFNFRVSSLVDGIRSSIPQDFEFMETDPIAIRFAKGVSYSPGEILKDVQEQIAHSLENFSQGFDFTLNVSEFLNNIPSGTIQLPDLPSNQREHDIGIQEISINNITIVGNYSIILPGNSEAPVSGLILPFDEANFNQVIIELTGIETAGVQIKVDGVTKQVNEHTQLFITKDSEVRIVNTTGTLKSGNITLKLVNPKLNYFKNLNLSEVKDDGKVNIQIPAQSISISNDNWKIKLSGTITGSIVIQGFSGNISQNYILMSGNTNLGTAAANTLNFTIPVNEVYFNVIDGITLEGSIELSGTVSADFRAQEPKVRYRPQLTLKAIKDYEFNVEVPKPDKISSIQFSNDSGYMVVNFTGLNLINATTTFGGNQVNAPQVRLLFRDVALPANATVKIEADVTANAISYNVSLPSDQTIKIANAAIDASEFSNLNFNVNYPIPDAIKEIVNSLYADIKINLNYNIKGVNGLNINITSNFFDNVSPTFNNTNGATQTYIITKANTIDFDTFSAFQFGISLNPSSNITLSNVNLREGAWIKFNAQIEKFNIDNVSIKEQSFTLSDLPAIDLDALIPDDLAFLREFEFDIEGLAKLEASNTTVPATITINLTSNSNTQTIVVQKGQVQDISNIIKNLLREGETINLSVTIQTGAGVLTTSSVLGFGVDLKFKFSLKAADDDIAIASGPVDLSVLNQVANIIKNGSIRFAHWQNTTGINVKIALKRDGTPVFQTFISEAMPNITISREELRQLSSGNVTYEIVVPKDQTLNLNYSGILALAPYIAVELEVATEVRFR